MRVLGYSNRLSVAAGGKIRFMVSCQSERYAAQVVRLRHGDLNPAGPGFKASKIASPIDGSYPGRLQRIHVGSYIVIPQAPPLERLRSFTLAAWICPTLPGYGREQALLGRWSASRHCGYGLFLGGEGDLVLKFGDGASAATVARTDAPLRKDAWYFVAASFDCDHGRAHLYQQSRVTWPFDKSSDVLERAAAPVAPGDPDLPFLLAAAFGLRENGGTAVLGHYNGKIDRPAVFSHALEPAEIDHLRSEGPSPGDAGLVAAWDFSDKIPTDAITDRSPHGLHGKAINMPMRGVTGHNWSGRKTCFAQSPEEYGAIHFHDDDLENAGWEADFELALPADWKSGVYAVRLKADDFEDYVPFFLRPAQGKATAPIAFLAPTLTYMAYANDHMVSAMGMAGDAGETLGDFLRQGTGYEQAVFRYIIEQKQHSLYDSHGDGSGVCYSSRLRPILNFRPRYNKPNLRFKYPHLLSCDLYLVDWLETRRSDFDVVTDEDLHAEGLALLAAYRVVVTGTHPEYWTDPMLRALEAYLRGGGRLMYMGGNGFYWVTSIDPMRPHMIEVRRGAAGSRAWTSAPGEHYHATTGELGGLWRHRGRIPQATVGIGFTAQCGLDRAYPYHRTKQSREPRVAFIFEGVEEDIIGDFGLHMGGAAGWELDRADLSLGTPPHALVLASSFGHSNAYQHAVEEVRNMDPNQGGAVNPLVRADLTYFEGPAGGAVFSVGSISWSGCLSHNNYDNNIARITGNVLNRFSDKS